MEQMKGGKKPYSGTYRHFKIVEVDVKQVKFGTADIKETQTPLNAAKKMLKSIAHEHNLKGNNKLKLKVVFSIQETTQGSSKKVFGPYSGKYHKYSDAEMKKATASGIKFRMKPVVKLYKGKSPMRSPMKSPKGQKGG